MTCGTKVVQFSVKFSAKLSACLEGRETASFDPAQIVTKPVEDRHADTKYRQLDLPKFKS